MNQDLFLLHVLSELNDLMNNMSPRQDLSTSLILDHQALLYSKNQTMKQNTFKILGLLLIHINLCFILDLINSATYRIRLQMYLSEGKILMVRKDVRSCEETTASLNKF